MKYKVIISRQVDIEADSKEEAEQKVIEEFDSKTIENFSKYGSLPSRQLQFDAILDSIQDENQDEKYNREQLSNNV